MYFMKQIFSGFTILFFITFLSSNSTAQCGKNLLNNSGFEMPDQTTSGSNTVDFDAVSNWRITEDNAILSDRICNLIKTNGNTFTNGPDDAVEGSQYFCLKNDKGTIYQDFTITGQQEINYSGFFSSKEQNAGYINWTASIDIVNIASNTVVSTSATKDFDNSNGLINAQEKWYYLSGSAILPDGSYRFVIHLGQFGNFDAAFLGSKCTLSSNAVQLKGNYTNEKILLQWSIPAQNENTLFAVEKSNNGKDFTKISTVPFSADAQYYFADKTPFVNAKNFYRIKKINTNGSAAYSNITRWRSYFLKKWDKRCNAVVLVSD